MNSFLEPRRRAGKPVRRPHGHPPSVQPFVERPETVTVPSANLPVHRTIVVVDVVSFTRPDRDNNDQLAIREALYATLARAFEEAGVPWHRCVHEDRGDGVLVFVSAEVSKVLLLGAVPRRLAELLELENTPRDPRRRFRLRMVVHAGEVHRDAHGYAGHDLNMAFRLVDAEPLRAAMAGGDAPVGLIVSDDVYQAIVRHRYGGLAPEAFQRVRVQVKSADAPGYIQLVGGSGEEPCSAPLAALAGQRQPVRRGPVAVVLSEEASLLDDLRDLGVDTVVLVGGAAGLGSVAQLPPSVDSVERDIREFME